MRPDDLRVSMPVFPSVIEYYQSPRFASATLEHRRAGSLGVEMILASQGGGERAAPAVDQLIITAALRASGPAEFNFGNGRQRVGELRAGMAHLQPARQHCYFNVREPHRVLFASLSHVALKSRLAEAGIDTDPFEPVYASTIVRQPVLDRLKSMWTAMGDGGHANDLYIDGSIIGLLSYFSILARTGGDWRAPVLDDPRLGRVIEFIEAHFGDPLAMDELAAVACLSTIQFSRAFKAATKLTPHQFVISRRIARAKDLLAHSHLQAVEIGLLCGFSSAAHFSSTFAKSVGVSPSEFRRDFQF